MNNAMLMKQLWKIFRYPDLFVSKILKEKYFRDGNLLSYTSKPSDSLVWKSICGVKEIFKLGVVLNVEEETPRWKYSSSGDYNVKSSYGIAYKWKLSKEGDIGEPSNVEVKIRVWSRFWKIKIPE